MALYINQTGKLNEAKEKPFKLQKDFQPDELNEFMADRKARKILKQNLK